MLMQCRGSKDPGHNRRLEKAVAVSSVILADKRPDGEILSHEPRIGTRIIHFNRQEIHDGLAPI